MQIDTNTLGPIEIDESRVITMTEPIPGVDSGGERYALIDVNPESPVKLLQSVESPHICFLVGDPAKLGTPYVVEVEEGDLAALGLDREAEAAVLVILNVMVGGASVTANLRAPIVINRTTFAGKQVILHQSDYDRRAPVVFSKE